MERNQGQELNDDPGFELDALDRKLIGDSIAEGNPSNSTRCDAETKSMKQRLPAEMEADWEKHVKENHMGG